MLNNLKILLIEDELLWETKMLMFLEEFGYSEPLRCRNINDARSILKDYIPDLIITDIMLGNSTIFELFNEEKYHKIPILFITSNVSNEFYDSSQKLLLTNYLIKPFHAISFDAAIKNILKNYERNLPLQPKGIKVRGMHGQTIWLAYQDIIYVKVVGNYCIFSTRLEKYAVKISISKLGITLGNSFLKIHRNILVNKIHIKFVNPIRGIVKTELEELSIGRTYSAAIKKYLATK